MDFKPACLFVALFVAGIAAHDLHAAVVEADLEALPMRYTTVDGRSDKFQAHHWMDHGYSGGAEEFNLAYKDEATKADIEMAGRAISAENDYEGMFSIRRPDIGFVHFEYQEFQKYYPQVGGVFRPFTTYRYIDIDRELAVDIGHFGVEAGLTLEGLPEFDIFYEREFKEGVKNRLTWGSVREGSVTRKIAPSFAEVNEIVDSFGFGIQDEIKGVELKARQRFDIIHSETMREELNFSTTATAADKKIRDQSLDLRANQMSTTLEGSRWFNEEKTYASGGYRYARIRNWESENIFEYDENRRLQSFANPEQVRDARAHNMMDSNTWVGSLMMTPAQGLIITTKLKSELLTREGDSKYPKDSTLGNPDGIINTTEISGNNQKGAKWGEGIYMRFTKIPRTALYNDLEFEQIRSWLGENRDSRAGQSAPNAGEIFRRETITYVRRGTWSVGGHSAISRYIDVTGQFRHRQNNNDYDDIHETDPTGTAARSAFFDSQNTAVDEFSSRLTFRPARWIRPAVRYVYRKDRFKSRFESEPDFVDSEQYSHNYTFNTTLTPIDRILFDAAFSHIVSAIRTPAANISQQSKTPAFRANMDAVQLALDYLVVEDVTFTSSLFVSRAGDFDDFNAVGLPLGAAFNQAELNIGIRCKLMKRFFVEPKYSFFHYHTNPDAEIGNYNAHVYWLEVGLIV